jgi:hypothetical protein
MKLSRAMLAALQYMDRVYGGSSVRFATGEALRKRGLAARHTICAIRADYVERNSVTPQWKASAKKPHLLIDWYITTAGRAALK